MIEELEKCKICPHECKINRNQGEKGRCKAADKVKIALYSTHTFEEPCISGKKGSGTVFFSNCNMNCIYCQNYEISQLGKGKGRNFKIIRRICRCIFARFKIFKKRFRRKIFKSQKLL